MQDATNDTDALSATYDLVSESQLALGRVLVNRLGIGEGSVVVDLGCGTGRLTLEVAERVGAGGHVIGMDPSPQRIRMAKGKIEGGALTNIEFVVGRAEDLSMIGSGTVDRAYYSSVFHWVAEKERALS